MDLLAEIGFFVFSLGKRTVLGKYTVLFLILNTVYTYSTFLNHKNPFFLRV